MLADLLVNVMLFSWPMLLNNSSPGKQNQYLQFCSLFFICSGHEQILGYIQFKAGKSTNIAVQRSTTPTNRVEKAISYLKIS